MYPTIYHAFKDLFGLELPILKLLQSFGFFVAIAFLFAAWLLAKELKRRSAQGVFKTTYRKVIEGAPASPTDLAIQFVFGFVLGWKAVGFIITPGAGDDPRTFLLSGEGSLVAGILTGIALAGWRWYSANKKKLPQPKETNVPSTAADHVGNITLMAALGGLLGAKLFHILENFGSFLEDPSGMIFSFSGLTMYGGLIMGSVFVLLYARKHEMPLLHLCDAAAPSLMLAYGIGRLGCQISGDGDWGIENTSFHPGFMPDWFWAYTYPNNVNGEGVPIPGCEGPNCSQLPFPVFPTPLYETIACCSLFIPLWIWRKKLAVPGLLFSIYLVMNGCERFLIELIRVNEVLFHIGSFPVVQAEIIALVLLSIGIFGIIWTRKKHRQQAAS